MILTLKELANYLRVNERTIQRMLRNGQIKGVKIGGQWRFNGSQIDQMFFATPMEGTVEDAVPLSELARSRTYVPLSRLLRENRMLLDLKSDTAEGVVGELIRPLAEQALVLDVKEVHDHVLAREQLLSTGIGRQLAIPHPRDPVSTLREPAVLILGRSDKGVAYKAVDDKPVRLFFLVCAQNVGVHLHVMGKLAHLLSDTAVVDAFLDAKGYDDIARAVMEAERRQFLTTAP
jgi:PTS system nitrogen regulatory IIA component